MAYKTPDPPTEGELEKYDTSTIAGRKRRQKAAVAMKISGANYSDIAQVLSYGSATDARNAVESSLAEAAGPEEKDKQRHLAARRLERLLQAVWRKATDPKDPEQLAAVRTGVAIIDRHTRLFGIDAPQEMVVYSPSGAQIDEWLALARKQLTGELPEEGDIIEGEVTDDSQ